MDKKTITSTLKFKVVDNATGELTEYPINDESLVNDITHAKDCGDIVNLGSISAGTRNPNFSLYFGDEIVADHVLQGQITSLTGGLQITYKQANNSNLLYRLIDDNGNLVGRVSRLSDSDILFVKPTNCENFVGNQQ